MAVVRCSRGHFYDAKKHMTCPYCAEQKDDDSVTVRMTDAVQETRQTNIMMEKALHYEGDFDEGKTIAIFSKEKGNDFVTGWLVCISGPEKGRSYALHYGFNRISRSHGPHVDITIAEDREITRGSHCAVVYEYNKNQFYVLSEEGNMVYLNGEFLEKPANLSTGDIIKVGNTELEFVAFCRGERKWEK